jgi:S1-C subfamily serine protease
MSLFSFNADSLAWRMKLGQKIEDPVKKIIQTAIQSSCTIYVDAGDQSWTGSGFHVGEGYIVTASHVVPPVLTKKPHEIKVSFDGETLYPAELQISDPNYDAGIVLSTPIAKNIPSVKLANSDTVEVGDIIAVLGSPEGFHDTATVGRITNVHQTLGQQAPSLAWQDILFFDADILEGASGGMLVLTDGTVAGCVMGVTGQHADVGVGQNAACPSNKIIDLLNKINR